MNFDNAFFRVGKYLKDGFEKMEIWDLSIGFEPSHRDSYLGFSEIHRCPICLYKKFSKLDSKPEDPSNQQFMKRIFMAGHIIEEVVVSALKLGGGLIASRQGEFLDFDGEFRGHCDLFLDEDLVVEIKSMNDNNFNNFVRKGVFDSHRHYYTQVQLYSYYSNKIPVIIALNKNNSNYHFQVLDRNTEYAEYYRRKARNIILASKLNDSSVIGSEFLQDCCQECFTTIGVQT